MVQVTNWPAAEQLQFVPEKVEYVKAEFSVSLTVIGLEPVGSPVGPLVPLLSMSTVKAAFDWPCEKSPPWALTTETVGRFWVRFKHQPPAAPVPLAFALGELK